MDEEDGDYSIDGDTQRQLETAYRLVKFMGKSSIAALATGGLSIVAGELFDLIVTDPSSKRRDRFIIGLGRRVDHLEKIHKLTLANLIDNEEAAAVFARATQAAMRSSGELKLRALRETAAKGLVDAASGRSGPAQVVIGFLDRMTEYHVIVLVWECDPQTRYPLGAMDDPKNAEAHSSAFYGQTVYVGPEGLSDPVRISPMRTHNLYVERSEKLSFELAHADLVAMGLLKPDYVRETVGDGRRKTTRITAEIDGYSVSDLGKTVRAYLAEDSLDASASARSE